MAKCDNYYLHGSVYRCYSCEHPSPCSCGGDTSNCDLFPEKRKPKPPRLKPCPFCGGEAEATRTVVKANGSYCDAVFVRCKNCDSRTGMVLFDARKHPNGEEYLEAEQAWNRRAQLTEVHQHGENCTHISNCGTLNLNL